MRVKINPLHRKNRQKTQNVSFRKTPEDAVSQRWQPLHSEMNVREAKKHLEYFPENYGAIWTRRRRRCSAPQDSDSRNGLLNDDVVLGCPGRSLEGETEDPD